MFDFCSVWNIIVSDAMRGVLLRVCNLIMRVIVNFSALGKTLKFDANAHLIKRICFTKTLFTFDRLMLNCVVIMQFCPRISWSTSWVEWCNQAAWDWCLSPSFQGIHISRLFNIRVDLLKLFDACGKIWLFVWSVKIILWFQMACNAL